MKVIIYPTGSWSMMPDKMRIKVVDWRLSILLDCQPPFDP